MVKDPLNALGGLVFLLVTSRPLQRHLKQRKETYACLPVALGFRKFEITIVKDALEEAAESCMHSRKTWVLIKRWVGCFAVRVCVLKEQCCKSGSYGIRAV